MDLFGDLQARGLVKQVTDESLDAVLSQKKITLYCGFDPTSDSLHIGSLLPLLTLRRFQQAGHRVIAVVGGATGMIGDPSGKQSERTLMNDTELRKNIEGVRATISRFLDLQGANPALVLDNMAWSGMTLVEFLRDVGKHFTVNYMMAKESVRSRLEDREHGISFTEFSYMLLQAHDFLHLHKKYGCTLQIGGSDQWGNITAGTDLVRKCGGTEVYGMTFPLVTKADGTKFGKTESGTIWLDAARTSPYRFYQYLLQTTDADAGAMLGFFSFHPPERIQQLEAATRATPEKREAQIALAGELTGLVHGREALRRAEKASLALFGSEIRDLDAGTLGEVFAGAPSTSKPRAAVEGGWALVDALAETGLCQSKGMARKDIAGGGVYINNERVTDQARVLGACDVLAGGFIVLRKGKKTYHLVRLS
ncbi:MAG: tyrosine--tRNA ligase [Bdellovibrionales bacterium RIFOXYD1_FULL_53_11]|nr:MAG: tyrosine--tRNA ligase [Bdellovibrionales bacterium RIFOXYD1_FULL_53_11]